MKIHKRCYGILILFLLSTLFCSCTNAQNSTQDGNQSSESPQNNGAVPGTDDLDSDDSNTTKPLPDVTPIEDESVPIGTRTNPLPLHTTALFNGNNTLFDTYQAEITLLEVIRGNEAYQMAMGANSYNSEPAEGKEYLFAKFRIRALSSQEDAVIDINSASFTVVSENGKTYDAFTSVSGLKPTLQEMYAGGTQEGYAYFEVDEDDQYPNLVFLERNNNGIWFSTDPNAALAEGSTVYVPAESIPKQDTTNATLGSRLNPFSIGEQATFNGLETVFDTYQANLTLTEINRGEEALALVTKANSYNDLPSEGMEYLLALFEVTATDSVDDAKIEINSANFELVSSAGIKYDDFVSIAGLEPTLTDMYTGNTQQGYVCFLVSKDDTNPTIVFLERNEQGIWFSCKGSGVNSP
ncbi:DUF4352 domain-containing protein [Anaerosporobacter faecicola]|uniref:DUF4352 domain-containing protein n=1 Tax=Anaerosporobacter faecicola TaxID=2718714 RepID=UPI00143932C9|nr:DUF4352 domain-containing protein [Anaerosporobacter faecicola]